MKKQYVIFSLDDIHTVVRQCQHCTHWDANEGCTWVDALDNKPVTDCCEFKVVSFKQ